MPQLIQLPKIVKHQGKFWIPPHPPNCDVWVGPYDDLKECKEAKAGLERTYNSPDWISFMDELEEEFENQWDLFEKEMEEERNTAQ